MVDLRSGLTKILDVFLPRCCPACNSKLLLSEKVICGDCLDDITIVTEEKLLFEFNKKFEPQGIISDMYSLFLFEKDEAIQRIIFSMKYERRYKTGLFLGELLGDAILQYRPEWEISFVVPIPLHRVRTAERGFNQSFYIAMGIENVTGYKANTRLIKRKKYTESQTKKGLEERAKNINEAFKVTNQNEVTGKNILLVDDVITTGSTVGEAAKILSAKGAANIYAASVALAD